MLPIKLFATAADLMFSISSVDHPGNECIPISEIVPVATSTASNSLR